MIDARIVGKLWKLTLISAGIVALGKIRKEREGDTMSDFQQKMCERQRSLTLRKARHYAEDRDYPFGVAER